jgi:hypothetical protein
VRAGRVASCYGRDIGNRVITYHAPIIRICPISRDGEGGQGRGQGGGRGRGPACRAPAGERSRRKWVLRPKAPGKQTSEDAGLEDPLDDLEQT